MNTGFIIFGLLINSFAYGLYRRLGQGNLAKAVWILLTIYGACIILAGVFQDDLNALDGVTTLEGILHNVFAQIAFWGLTIGIWIFARTVHLNTPWRGFTQLSIAVAIFNLLSSMVFLMEFSKPFEGLLQRSFYAISLIWIAAVSIRVLFMDKTK